MTTNDNFKSFQMTSDVFFVTIVGDSPEVMFPIAVCDTIESAYLLANKYIDSRIRLWYNRIEVTTDLTKNRVEIKMFRESFHVRPTLTMWICIFPTKINTLFADEF